jgi:hypothetical protein
MNALMILLAAQIQNDAPRQVEALVARFQDEDPQIRERALAQVIQRAVGDYRGVRKTLLAARTAAKDPEVRARIEAALDRLPRLTVTFRTAEKELKIGQAVDATVRINNHSDEEVTLVAGGERSCIRFPAFRLEFHQEGKLHGSSEAPVPAAGIFEWGTEELIGDHEFLALKPGESIRIASDWGGERRFVAPRLKPGRYSVRLALDFARCRARSEESQPRLAQLPGGPYFSDPVEVVISE